MTGGGLTAYRLHTCGWLAVEFCSAMMPGACGALMSAHDTGVTPACAANPHRSMRHTVAIVGCCVLALRSGMCVCVPLFRYCLGTRRAPRRPSWRLARPRGRSGSRTLATACPRCAQLRLTRRHSPSRTDDTHRCRDTRVGTEPRAPRHVVNPRHFPLLMHVPRRARAKPHANPHTPRTPALLLTLKAPHRCGASRGSSICSFQMGHRHGNALVAALGSGPGLRFASLIADGVHLPPHVLAACLRSSKR